MGTLTLVLRLARRDLGHRRANALLLVIALAAATTTLTLGLVVRGVTERPWERTRAATAGPDAVATVPVDRPGTGRAGTDGAGPDSAGPDSAGTDGAGAAAALARAPGVIAVAGPFPTRYVPDLRVRGMRVAASVQGRDVRPGAIDRPKVTHGTWVRSGGVVVERAFATALDTRPGERITIAGHRFSVAGIAITSARPPYPSSAPGLVWSTRTDLRLLADPAGTDPAGTDPAGAPAGGGAERARAAPLKQVLALRLADPDAAPRFAAAHRELGVRSWQEMGEYATAELRLVNSALLTGTWALALLAMACVAVLVGGRLAEQTRRVGLLKAVGATPRFVAAVLLAEHVLLALVAGAVGIVAGWAAAPLLVRPSSGLLALDVRPPVTPATALIVLAAAVAVAGAATVWPAIRGARTSTVRALSGPAGTPRRSPRLIAWSARLPVPFLLGVRLMARRPRRAALAAVSLAITVAMVVAAIALRGDIARKDAQAVGIDFVPGAGNPVTEQVNQVVVVLMVALLALAAVNAVLVAWATSLDALRATALARALGATPRQVATGLAASQLLPATVAGVLGIPMGLLVYSAARAAGGAAGEAAMAYGRLSLVLPGTLIVVALLTLVPIRASGRRPVAEVLRAD